MAYIDPELMSPLVRAGMLSQEVFERFCEQRQTCAQTEGAYALMLLLAACGEKPGPAQPQS